MRVVAWALTLSACGPGLHAVDQARLEPLVTISGRFVATTAEVEAWLGDTEPGVDPSRPLRLRAALVWGGRSSDLYACSLLPADSPTRAACPDPRTFVMLPSAVTTEVAADGTFELDVRELPPVEVTVGGEGGRLAYGGVVVFLPFNDVVTGAEIQSFVPNASIALASSFATGALEQRRIVYREGDVVEEHVVYPLPACPAPPRGFSLLDVGVPGADGTSSCALGSLATSLDLGLLDHAVADEISCASLHAGDSWVFSAQEVSDSPFLPTGDAVCLDHGTYVLPQNPYCPWLQVVTLRGCHRPPCEVIEFDDTASPPAWWPC